MERLRGRDAASEEELDRERCRVREKDRERWRQRYGVYETESMK